MSSAECVKNKHTAHDALFDNLVKGDYIQDVTR